MNTAEPNIDAQLHSLATICLQKKLMLATAESCTGGGVGETLTQVSGSSAWYLGGVISYSNQLKQQLLQVPEELLQTHGAVSEACALAMLEGAIKLTGADLAVSVTGIAGPDGGSDEKPVGTVCFAAGSAENNQVRTCLFEGDRQQVRRQSIDFAVSQLLISAQGWSNP